MAAAKASGLLDEFRAHDANNRPGTKCSVGLLLRKLPPDVAAQVVEALADPGISSKAIANVLTARGWEIGDGPVSRHRRKDCKC